MSPGRLIGPVPRIAAAAVLVATSAAVARSDVALRNVALRNGAYMLAAGPNIEGVVYLHGAAWPEHVIRTFHDVPWIDAASIRLKWADVEPADQQFNWRPFDRVLQEVRKYNAAHRGARRHLHLRIMAGNKYPRWFGKAGVETYETLHAPDRPKIRVPMPFDNPKYLKQLREVYRAMYERYTDEPLVKVYHGTWTGALWAEIFHPQRNVPRPPGYTREKFIRGMVDQVDILLDEFAAKGKVCEVPYSGKYPPLRQIDLTGPVTARIVQRFGRRSPFVYISNNGWGMTAKGRQTPSWGHEDALDAAVGKVNLVFQALGTNKGRGWMAQGDWVPLVKMLQKYDAAYAEVYSPDFRPMDTAHHIVEAFNQREPSADGFVGFRPWLGKNGRVRYLREGTIRQGFRGGGRPRGLSEIRLDADVPQATRVTCRARSRTGAGPWSDWVDGTKVQDLPPGSDVEVEARLHTDDGYFSPKVRGVKAVWASSPGASERPGREGIPSSAPQEGRTRPPDTDVARLICGTWVLQQAGSVRELASFRSKWIDAALKTPHVRGFSLRVPWKAVDEDFALLAAGRKLARQRKLGYSIRFMAGRHTPARVFDKGCACYTRRSRQGAVERVAAPFRPDGSPNTLFEKEYDAFVARLARWCRREGVHLLHLAWYGQDWAELNHGREVRGLKGYSYEAWLTAHRRLIDIGLKHADATLAVELPFSGYGPLTDAAVAMADHVVRKIGPSKTTFFCQANGWGRAGEWGAPNAGTEAAFDRVWRRPICRGLQAIQPRDFDWAEMYAKVYAARATYCEVYAPSFAGRNKAQLAAEIEKFARHCRQAPPLPEVAADQPPRR